MANMTLEENFPGPFGDLNLYPNNRGKLNKEIRESF